jgi:hypothetical protein
VKKYVLAAGGGLSHAEAPCAVNLRPPRTWHFGQHNNSIAEHPPRFNARLTNMTVYISLQLSPTAGRVLRKYLDPASLRLVGPITASGTPGIGRGISNQP